MELQITTAACNLVFNTVFSPKMEMCESKLRLIRLKKSSLKIVFLKNPLWKHKSSTFLNKHHCYYYAEVTYTRKSQTYWFGNIKIWIVNFILSYHCFMHRPHLLHWATTESQSCIFFLYRLRQRFVNSELLNGVVCFLASFYFYFFFLMKIIS